MDNALPIALTIAGLDPSGGAGVIADLRAFRAFRCSPAVAITSITFQNDKRVYGAEHLSEATVSRQVMAVLENGPPQAVKTGMLPTRSIVQEVARLIKMGLPAPVVDPVQRSTSGYDLIETDAVKELYDTLFPLARVVTPNIPEAEQITGQRITDLDGMIEAAKTIRASGARAVLIKGGHLEPTSDTPDAVDLLDNEGIVTVYRSERIPNAQLRGTGCLLSAAIASCLAWDKTLEESVSEARQFVVSAILEGSGIVERATP